MGQDPESLREDIERTRLDLGRDVDALSDKMSPRRAIGRRAQRTRAGLVNLRYRVMGTARHSAGAVQQRTADTASQVSDTASGVAAQTGTAVGSAASTVQDAARRTPEVLREQTAGNPLAAGVIAFGAGWLASSLLPPTTPERLAGERIRDTAQEYAEPVAEEARRTAREVAEEMREPAKEAAQSVRDRATEGAQTVAERGRQAGTEVTAEARQAGSRMADEARR